VGSIVAAGAGQQRAQPQQRDVAHDQGLIGAQISQLVDRLFSFRQIVLGATLEQRLDENACPPDTMPQPSS
jgi:hypothetical protein